MRRLLITKQNYNKELIRTTTYFEFLRQAN